MATKFFKCTVCGNVVVKYVDSSIRTVCCGKEMVELKPGTTDGKLEYHVPVVERVDDCTIKVRIGAEAHPMTDQHHIAFIYLETEHGGQIQYLDIDTPAEAKFYCCNDNPIAVYAYCNLHGLWKTDLQCAESEKHGDSSKAKDSCRTNYTRGRSCCGWFALIIMSFFAISCSAQSGIPAQKMDSELDQYLDSWFAIARNNDSFAQRVFFPSTRYKITSDGEIQVIHSGFHGNDNYKKSLGKHVQASFERILAMNR